MEKLLTLLISFFLLFSGCSRAPSSSSNVLTPSAFNEKINTTPDAVIIDVRTPDEFNEGHLPNAINVNWEGNNFDPQTNKLDKTKPVFVYCQRGGRGESASRQLRASGFKEVFELEGGLSNWQKENMLVTK